MNIMERINLFQRTHTAAYMLKTMLILLLSLVFFASCAEKEESTPIVPQEPEEDLTLPDTLKIISYNILEGMKNDKANNYNKFVEWVNTYKPDVLALEEVNGFRQKDLEKLAARWGHPYVITNVKSTDNYPVALTSKYPIVSRRKVTLNVSHGAIFAKLRDADLNIVVTHLWPQAYWKTVGDDRGNEYRLQETNIVLDSTIRKFPNEKNWLFMGDFNSRNRKDYNPPVTTNNYWVMDQIEADGYTDVIHYLYGNKSDGVNYDFQYPGTRIDFMFGTPTVLSRVTKAMFIYDEFTAVASDHRPVMTHILLKETTP